MSSMLSLPPPAPSRFGRFIKIILGCMLFICILGLWLMLSRIESRQSSLSLQLIPLTAPISTAFTEIYVDLNQEVKEGQQLAKIDVAGYEGELPHAVALVQGAMPAQIASRVTQAEAIEAEMVKRVALARHEENAQRRNVEQFSIEHAKMLLHLRSISQDEIQRYRAAAQKEQAMKHRFQSAKDAFEFASRQRVAIEMELYKIRDENAKSQRYTNSDSQRRQAALKRNSIADDITAPISGRVIGAFPQIGEVVPRDGVLFTLLPDGGANLKLMLSLSTKHVEALRSGLSMYLVAQDMLLQGDIENISPVDKNNFIVNLSCDSLSMEQIMRLYSLEKQGQVYGKVNKTAQANAGYAAENAVPVRAVFWSENIFTQYITPLEFLIKPLLAAWENTFGI